VSSIFPSVHSDVRRLRIQICFLPIDAPIAQRLNRNSAPGHGANYKVARRQDFNIAIKITKSRFSGLGQSFEHGLSMTENAAKENPFLEKCSYCVR
jgi:hypothetical protein